MSLVVQHHDRAALKKLAQAVSGKGLVGLLALLDHGIALAAFAVFGFRRKEMPVGDQDLAGSQKVAILRGHEIELGVVVITPAVRPEDLEALLDRQIRAADEHGVGKAVIARHPGAVAEGPGDEHRHDDGLAAAGGHLAAKSCQGLDRSVHHLPEEIEIGVGELGVPARLAPLAVAPDSREFR